MPFQITLTDAVVKLSQQTRPKHKLPQALVKHVAFSCVTEQVGYGCFNNLLSPSPLYMDPQFKRALLSSDYARIIK